MPFVFSLLLLANVNTTSYTSTNVEGTGITYTHNETTVNGNTTTVNSDKPGTIKVEKTDTGETVTSDNPVSVTHSTTSVTPTPTIVPKPTPTSFVKTQFRNNPPKFITLLRSLWDRAILKLLGGHLTRK